MRTLIATLCWIAVLFIQIYQINNTAKPILHYVTIGLMLLGTILILIETLKNK